MTYSTEGDLNVGIKLVFIFLYLVSNFLRLKNFPLLLTYQLFKP